MSLLLACGLIIGAGCSSRESEETGADPAAGEAAAVEPNAEVAIDNAAATPAAEQEKTAAMVEALLAQVDQLIAERNFTDAKDRVMQALNWDANNAMAQAKLAAINELMGQSTNPQDMASQVVEYKQALRQKKRLEVEDAYNRAQNEFNAGDYKTAAESLEYAKLIMEYDGLQTDFGTRPGDVAQFLAETKRKVDSDTAIREEQQYQDTVTRIRAEEDKDRAARAETVRLLMTEGVQAFSRQDFDTAESLGKQVMEISPGFTKAADLVEASRAARNSQWRARLYAKRNEQFTDWMNNVRAAQIPWTQLLQFPSAQVWDKIKSRRRPNDAVQANLEDSEVVQAIKNQLENTRVSWNFTDNTLLEVVTQIRDTQQLNIQVSPAAATDKGAETIEMTVRDMKFGAALRNLLEPLELVYTYRFDLLYIAKKDESFGNVIPRVYEVRDLTIQLPNFKAPSLQLRPGPAGESAQNAVFGTEDEEKTVETQPEQLLDLIKENVEPTSWEVEGHDMSLNSNQLVVVTTPDVHAKVEAFLDDLRRYTKIVVHVETRFISIRKGFLSEFGIDFRGTGNANPGTVSLLDDINNGNDDNASAGLDNNGPGLPAAASLSPTAGFFFNDRGNEDYRGRTENIFDRALGGFLTDTGGATIGVTILDDIQISALIRAVEKSTFANVLTAPRLTIYNNQRANLTIVNQVTYIKDYDVEVAQTAFIADPLVDIVQDGLVLDVRPVVSHDRRYVTLEVQPTVATLNRPIQTFLTPLAGLTTSVIIELPEIEYRSTATTVKVPDNGYLIIGGLKDVSTVDRRSETPILSQIPILSFFFSKKGRSDEISDLIIILHVSIIDLSEEEHSVAR